MSSAGGGAVEEEPELVPIREVLSGTILRVSHYSDNGIFSDINSFVKLSEGNTSIINVHFYPYDKEGNDELWEKMGKGLANLKSLQRFIINFDEDIHFEEETTTDELTSRADFGTLAIALPYVRQELRFDALCEEVSLTCSREEVKALALAIRRHPTIKEFNTGCDFPLDTLHIILSALATLPSLEFAQLGHDFSEGSHFHLPEALKELMLSPSLRKVYFEEFTFSRPLCRALGEALQGGSNVAWLSFDACSFPQGASQQVARALKQNTMLTTFKLSGKFSQAFYDAFASALLVNTTLTKLQLNFPKDEAEAALIAPVFLALGMNKALKKLTINQLSSSVDGKVYLVVLDGLEKNSTLEILHIYTFSAEKFSVSLLSSILPFLRVSATLKSLEIKFQYVVSPHTHVPHVATSCLAIVTASQQENSSLETLKIDSVGGVSPDTYIAALERLQPDATLKELHLSPMIALFGKVEMNQVVSLVKKNYTLTKLSTKYFTELDKTGELHAILRLNQAGRRYLIEDAGSIAKGVEVLIDVRDDLDCLFYHLLENPMLCDIEHQYAQSGIPRVKSGRSHGTKRARLLTH